MTGCPARLIGEPAGRAKKCDGLMGLIAKTF
jgi:hypothetical protein